MWLYLLAARTPLKKIDQQPNTMLFGLWKALILEQQFRPAPPAPTISDGLPAPAKASGIQSCFVWYGCLSYPEYRMQERLPAGESHGSIQKPQLTVPLTGPQK